MPASNMSNYSPFCVMVAMIRPALSCESALTGAALKCWLQLQQGCNAGGFRNGRPLMTQQFAH